MTWLGPEHPPWLPKGAADTPGQGAEAAKAPERHGGEHQEQPQERCCTGCVCHGCTLYPVPAAKALNDHRWVSRAGCSGVDAAGWPAAAVPWQRPHPEAGAQMHPPSPAGSRTQCLPNGQARCAKQRGVEECTQGSSRGAGGMGAHAARRLLGPRMQAARLLKPQPTCSSDANRFGCDPTTLQGARSSGRGDFGIGGVGAVSRGDCRCFRDRFNREFSVRKPSIGCGRPGKIFPPPVHPSSTTVAGGPQPEWRHMHTEKDTIWHHN